MLRIFINSKFPKPNRTKCLWNFFLNISHVKEQISGDINLTEQPVIIGEQIDKSRNETVYLIHKTCNLLESSGYCGERPLVQTQKRHRNACGHVCQTPVTSVFSPLAAQQIDIFRYQPLCKFSRCRFLSAAYCQ